MWKVKSVITKPNNITNNLLRLSIFHSLLLYRKIVKTDANKYCWREGKTPRWDLLCHIITKQEGRENNYRNIAHGLKAVPPRTSDLLSHREGKYKNPTGTSSEKSVHMNSATRKQYRRPPRISDVTVKTDNVEIFNKFSDNFDWSSKNVGHKKTKCKPQ